MNLDNILSVPEKRKGRFSNYYDITADSEPDHDNWGLQDDIWGLFGGNAFWGCLDWIAWHIKLVEKYGKSEADNRWVTEYDKSTWGSHEINCSTGNDEFKTYVQKQGLDKKSTILTKVYRAESAIGTITDPVASAAKAAARTAKVLSWAIPVTVGLAGLGIIAFGYLKYIKPNLKPA